jgi:hypothetical protein
MYKLISYSRAVLPVLVIALLASTAATAQKKQGHRSRPAGSKITRSADGSVLWHKVDVANQDTLLGPGGSALQPDLSRVEFVERDTSGTNLKYKIRDAAGTEWIAKIGKEAQAETAAVRLLSALGYYTDVNYLVPTLTIPSVGTFTNVRLALRPKDVDRKELWSWGKTPFEGTPQMRGLLLMMAFINNWDLKATNNHVLKGGGPDRYIVGDLGATFGKTGSNSLPIFFRIGRSRNDPKGYANTKLVSGVSRDKVHIVFHGKNRSRMHNFTKEDARWLADLLLQLKDDQIRDMFRAANYSNSDIDTLTGAVKDRIVQLDRAASDRRINGRR